VFLHDVGIQKHAETIQDIDSIMNQIQGITIADLILTFQTYDQITRRYKDFVPDRKLSADYGVFTIEVFLNNIKLSNDATPKAP